MLSLLEVPAPDARQERAFPAHRTVYFGHGIAGRSWRGLVPGSLEYAVTGSGAAEVLFDLDAHPFELDNPVSDPDHAEPLGSLRAAVHEHARALDDDLWTASEGRLGRSASRPPPGPETWRTLLGRTHPCDRSSVPSCSRSARARPPRNRTWS